MIQTSQQDPGKRFHAELTARLRCGLPRRWIGTVRPHLSAGRLKLGLSRRLAAFRGILGSRARSRWSLSIPVLSLHLLRRWRKRSEFRFSVQLPTVSPVISFIASFRSHIALWTMSRTPASSLARESRPAPPRSSPSASGHSQKSVPPRRHGDHIRSFLNSRARSEVPFRPLIAGLRQHPMPLALQTLHLMKTEPVGAGLRLARFSRPPHSQAPVNPLAVGGATAQETRRPRVSRSKSPVLVNRVFGGIASAFATHRSLKTAHSALLRYRTLVEFPRGRVTHSVSETRFTGTSVRRIISADLPDPHATIRIDPLRSPPTRQVAPPRSLEIPMPLLNPARTAPLTSDPIWTERTRREATESILHQVGSVVEREVRRQMRSDSPEVRRLSDFLYSDLGSRIVFERERLGKT
jgi:hypothetical protein